MSQNSDYEGIFGYKLIVPAVYLLSWGSMVAGPIYFDRSYQITCVAVMLFSIFKTFILGMNGAIALRKMNKVLSQGQTKTYVGFNDELVEEIIHAIVVPNYNEQIELLCETLDVIAKHQKAKTYFIFLAMEAHEKGCEKKGQFLTQKYKHTFRAINFTVHQLQEGEAKNKASNINWCANHMKQVFDQYNISMNSVMITFVDADTWIPKLYISEVEARIRQNPQNKHKMIFAAPQIFTRNSFKTSVIVRVHDMLHSFVHLSNLPSLIWSFPMSNYTFSYEFYKRCGGFDTCSEAVGDDFHIVQKAYWKTKGDIITMPIYVPFNQLCLVTGKGMIADTKARFWQAERHTQGVTDVAYNVKMFFHHAFELKSLVMVYYVFQTFTLSATIPWCMVSLILRYIVMSEEGISGEGWVFSWFFVNVLINVANIANCVSYIIYEKYKRTANKEIYSQTNQPLWRMLEFPVLFMVVVFGITVPSFTYSAFSLICMKRTYHVTEKAGAGCINTCQKINSAKSFDLAEYATMENVESFDLPVDAAKLSRQKQSNNTDKTEQGSDGNSPA